MPGTTRNSEDTGTKDHSLRLHRCQSSVYCREETLSHIFILCHIRAAHMRLVNCGSIDKTWPHLAGRISEGCTEEAMCDRNFKRHLGRTF